MWYFPYIYIYIWTIAARRIQVYIFLVLSVYTYLDYCRKQIHICGIAIYILVVLPRISLSCCRNTLHIANILVVLSYIFVFVGSHRFLRSKHFSFVMVNINSINIWICSLVESIHGCTSAYCWVVSNMKKGSFLSQWCWHCWKFQPVVCCVSIPLWLNKIQKWKFKNQALVAWFAKFILEKWWFVKIPTSKSREIFLF